MIACVTVAAVLSATGCKRRRHAPRRIDTEAHNAPTERDPAWKRQVEADQKRVAQLVAPGAEPRVIVARPLARGETLEASIAVRSNVEIVGNIGPRKSEHSIDLRMRMRWPTDAAATGEPRILLEIVELSGDLEDIEHLPREGSVQAGAFGEPWVVVMQPTVEQRAALKPDAVTLWEHDVKEWARRVLVPVPPEPIGVGAIWTREFEDYFAGDKVREEHRYRVVSIADGVATIEATATSRASVIAGHSEATATATLSLPVGRRDVPRTTWTSSGHSTLTQQDVNITISGTVQIRPYESR